jgi:hypothetical protein
MPNKEEIIKYYNKIFADFNKDPKSSEKIEEFRRKYSKLTEEDLLKTFTI